MKDKYFVIEDGELEEITPESGEFMAGERDILLKTPLGWFFLLRKQRNPYDWVWVNQKIPILEKNIPKIRKLLTTQPHDNKTEESWREKWNIHQIGCDWNRNRIYGSKVCDMNCYNCLDTVISQIRQEAVQSKLEELEREVEARKTTSDDIEPNGGYCLEFADGYDTALDTVLAIIREKK